MADKAGRSRPETLIPGTTRTGLGEKMAVGQNFPNCAYPKILPPKD
jgi:hypothetical protein